MARIVIKQPDGRYAVWQTSGDHFVMYGARADEVAFALREEKGWCQIGTAIREADKQGGHSEFIQCLAKIVIRFGASEVEAQKEIAKRTVENALPEPYHEEWKRFVDSITYDEVYVGDRLDGGEWDYNYEPDVIDEEVVELEAELWRVKECLSRAEQVLEADDDMTAEYIGLCRQAGVWLDESDGEPEEGEDLPRIYLVDLNRGEGRDVCAAAIAEDGEGLAMHICSSRAYMGLDLGEERHDELYSEKYPDGYQLVTLENDSPIIDRLANKNSQLNGVIGD